QSFGRQEQDDQGGAQSFGAEEAPEGVDSSFEALPAFEELMADLPSRRSSTQQAKTGQKRGLFGRRPGQPATGELRAYQPQQDRRPIQTVSSPVSHPATGAVTAVPSFGGPAPSVETQSLQAAAQAPQDVYVPNQPQDFESLSRPQAVRTPQASGPATGAFQAPAAPTPAPAAPLADPTYPRGFQEGYQRAVQESLGSGHNGPAGGTVPVPEQTATQANPFVEAAPRAAAPAPAPAAPQQAPSAYTARPAAAAPPMAPAQPGPARAFPAPHPTGAVYDPTYASPAPLAQRAAGTDDDGKDPLDPEYVRDSVEARSEWTASAVLYEEMTSLLRRGAFQEDDVKENDSYRPASVSTEGSTGGLTRRTRG